MKAEDKSKAKHHLPPPERSPLNAPLFTKEWSVADELLLLEAVSMFGLEDWPSAATFLGNKCSPGEVRDHYYKYYVFEDQSQLLPDESEWVVDKNVNPFHYAKSKHQYERKEGKEEGSPSQGMKVLLVNLPNSFGVYEKTKQFNSSYFCSLEYLISNLSILPGESEATKNEKIKLVHDYLEKLQERKFVERKSIEEGLFETKIEIEQEAKRPAEERRKRRKRYIREKCELEKEPDEPTKRLWVTYSKARKHDENGELKALLDEYFQNDARIGELNRRIVRELEHLQN